MSDLCHNCGNCHLGFDAARCPLPLRDCLLCHGKGHTFTFCPLGVRQLDENYQYWMLCHNCDAWHLPDPCRLPLVECARCPGIGHLPLFCPVDPQPRKEPLGDPTKQELTQESVAKNERMSESEGKQRIKSPSPPTLQQDVRGIHPELLQKIKFRTMLDLCATMGVEPPMQMLRGLAGLSDYCMDGCTAVPNLSEAQQYTMTGNFDTQSGAQYATPIPFSVAEPRDPSRDEVLQVAQALQMPLNMPPTAVEHASELPQVVPSDATSTAEVPTTSNQYLYHQMPQNSGTPVDKAKSKKPPRPRKERAQSTRCDDCTRKHKRCTHTTGVRGDIALASDAAQMHPASAGPKGRKRRKTTPAAAGDEQTHDHAAIPNLSSIANSMTAETGVEPPTAATAHLTPFAVPPPPPSFEEQSTNHTTLMSSQPRSVQGLISATSGMQDHATEVRMGHDQERDRLRLPLPQTDPFEVNQHGQVEWFRSLPPIVLENGLEEASCQARRRHASDAQWRPMVPTYEGHGNGQPGYRSANNPHEYAQGGQSHAQRSAQEDAYSRASQISNMGASPTTAQYHHTAPHGHAQHHFSQDSHHGSEVFVFGVDCRATGTQQISTTAMADGMLHEYGHIHASPEDGLASAPRTIPLPDVGTASAPTESDPTNTRSMLLERDTSF